MEKAKVLQRLALEPEIEHEHLSRKTRAYTFRSIPDYIIR